uniref:Macronuclear development protein 1 n=1 Tax=Stylonychia lemnae TaxID=5949 RepID=Q8ISG8_STYLE|nr:macronuclear development protein 1 [Stylonychia lemnae]
MESALTVFPKKPTRSGKLLGQELKLFSNYFSLVFDSPSIQGVNKYTCKFEPEVPDNSRKVRTLIIRTVKEKIKEKLEFFIEWGNCIYSLKKVQEIPKLETEHDGVKYTISIDWVQLMEATDKDHMNFLKIFFNSLMRGLRFETIGRKSFNSAKAHSLDAHKIKVWPGFDARLIMKEQGVLLNIDVCFKVVRQDTVLEFINDLRSKCEQKNLDFQEEIMNALKGTTVVTKYNQRTYKVERVDFSMSPETTFDKSGTQVSYKDYYKTRYNESVNEPNQPLLINKDRKTGNEIALIPELCQVTGLTDSMRADFRLMKDLAEIVHTNADRKVAECKNLLEIFNTNPKCLEKQKLWHLKFTENPQPLKGYKYKAGNMVMGAKGSGERNTFDIESCAREIARKIQDKMFDQPALKTWGIFHGDRDAQVCKQFQQTMEQVLQQFGFESATPQTFVVKGNAMQSNNWIKELKSRLNNNVQAAVLLLPGAKGKTSLYDDIKRFLLAEFPVPSQVVLCNTISKGKNLRSIVNKILIQITAKIGGIPWTVDALPFMDKPTMICGMDVFHSTSLGKKSVLGLTASINVSATKYFSSCVIQGELGLEASHSLQNGMVKGLEAFKKANGAYPQQVIFYRDGVGEGQVNGVCIPEIEQIKAAIASLSIQVQFMYINVSKRINTRIFGGDVGSFKNPMPGTCFDATITDTGIYEFFLVSTSAKQGLSSPVRYSVLYDGIGDTPDKIELLTYKLCYTYYNVSGSIKEPSAIRYAHRLAALIGERGGRGKEPPQPHEDFETKDPTLYYI